MSYTHKQGTTFDCSGTIAVADNGVPVPDLTGWLGASQLRTAAGVLVADLAFTWLDASRCLCRLHAANTAAWPLGRLQLDIRLTSPAGVVLSTSTAVITVEAGVTRA